MRMCRPAQAGAWLLLAPSPPPPGLGWAFPFLLQLPHSHSDSSLEYGLGSPFGRMSRSYTTEGKCRPVWRPLESERKRRFWYANPGSRASSSISRGFNHKMRGSEWIISRPSFTPTLWQDTYSEAPSLRVTQSGVCLTLHIESWDDQIKPRAQGLRGHSFVRISKWVVHKQRALKSPRGSLKIHIPSLPPRDSDTIGLGWARRTW